MKELILATAMVAAGYMIGYKIGSTPENCALVISQEFKDKSALQRAIASSMAESEREDFLTDMCKDDPKQCDAGRAVIQPVKK